MSATRRPLVNLDHVQHKRPACPSSFVLCRIRQLSSPRVDCLFPAGFSPALVRLYTGYNLRAIHIPAVSGYRCSKCEYMAATQEGLTVHMSQMHKERYECKDCNGLVLNTKSQWQEHLRTYHNNNAMISSNKDKQAVAAVSDAAASPLSMLGGQLPHMDPTLMANLIAMMPFLQAATAQGAMASMAAAMAAMQPLQVDSSMMTKGTPSEAGTPSPQAKYTRNYQCGHESCNYASRESRAYLHHLRDEHDEVFPIFYCDMCSYASRHLAKVKRHTSLIHGQDAGSDDVKSETVDGEDDENDRLMISESPEVTPAAETPTQ
uniref:C2H2-type domain-containing protein n=1 Tax=Plectus sambesii TaxID=2011161 RepID=A0A914V5Z6_9BILA